MFLLDFGLLLVAGLFQNHMETCSAGTQYSQLRSWPYRKTASFV